MKLANDWEGFTRGLYRRRGARCLGSSPFAPNTSLASGDRRLSINALPLSAFFLPAMMAAANCDGRDLGGEIPDFSDPLQIRNRHRQTVVLIYLHCRRPSNLSIVAETNSRLA
jgi:hypothetical protein